MMMLVTGAMVGIVPVGAQSSDPYVHVMWEESSSIEEFEHTEQNSMWVFGPQPVTRAYYYNNDTDISENDYLVRVGTELEINVTVPTAFLRRGVGLESVVFWGRGRVDRSPIFVVKYNVTADNWESLAFVYVPGSQEPVASSFIVLDTEKSSYQSLPDCYIVSFHIKYQTLVAPVILWTGLQIIDTKNSAASPSWLAALSGGGFETPPLGLEMRVKRVDFGLPNYYYAEVTDTEGDIIHHVEFDDVFVFHLTANIPLSDVLIPFSLVNADRNSGLYYNYTYLIPNDPFRYHTTWTRVDGVPPMLLLLYDGSTPTVAAGYIDNVNWIWDFSIGMWYPTFSFLINNSIDISKFYVLLDTQVLNGGATLSWTGYYTNMTDMNPDPYKVGATIVPDPFFWRVIGSDDEALLARPEIKTHNTVRLAFMEHFIEATVTHNGDVVHRVQQGDILNITLRMFGPGSMINGSTYIPTDITIPAGNDTVNMNGLLLHVRRDNFTIYALSREMGRNATHYWTKIMNFSVTLYYPSQTYEWTVSNTTIYYELGSNIEVDRSVELHNDWLTVYDAGLSIGVRESILWLDISFGSQVPDMRVSEVHLNSGFRLFGQWNVSIQGTNTSFWYPSSVNWDNAYSYINLLDGMILWTPNQFFIGNIDPWVPESWTVTSDGALDLDGNVFTTGDQYYVMRTGYWHDWGNTTVRGMMVGVVFDPTPGVPNDEFVSRNWMGIVDMTIEFSANETFYWYHASDFSRVNLTEMNSLRQRLWSDDTYRLPNPGYRYVAWMTVNRTLELGEITGLPDNVWHNTWLAWGTQQTFTVSTSATSTTWAIFRAKYAGLLLFNDTLAGGAESAPDFAIVDGRVVTEEVTHLVLIDSVGSVEFRHPFGSTNSTGNVVVAPDVPVSFGISIYDVEVTIYPLRVEHSDGLRGAWDFRQSYEGALSLNPDDFDYCISHASVDEISFDITFSVDMVQFDPNDESRWNHAVSFKVDQRFGDWTLDEFSNSVLEGRSLAVNFFGVIGTATRSQYRAGTTPLTSTNDASLSSSYYQFGAHNTPFAEVEMGGLPYTWGGDGHTRNYTSGSSTAPIGAFSLMYESVSGVSITDWQVDASMLFMTAGYKNWGGHDIICDPVFVSYVSAMHSHTTTTTTTGTTTTTSIEAGGGLMEYLIIGGTIAVIVVMICFLRRRQ